MQAPTVFDNFTCTCNIGALDPENQSISIVPFSPSPSPSVVVLDGITPFIGNLNLNHGVVEVQGQAVILGSSLPIARYSHSFGL